MLHQIRPKARDGQDRGPVGLLLDCHERIRTFSGMAERLSTAHDAPAEDVALAARRVRRYFELALPSHEEDEERSIAPRLLASSGACASALTAMAAEHARAHELLAALEGAWDVLVETPRELAALSARISGPSAELRALFSEHLALEEREIFPLVERLPAGERAAIVAEMRARRETESWSD
jgi:hemerythrin-like domain-containing protein